MIALSHKQLVNNCTRSSLKHYIKCHFKEPRNDGNGENKTINEDEKLEEAIEEQHKGNPHYDLSCKTVYPVIM